ncbi:E3 ubiquitin-protein ligase TRIM71-like [Saccoglossus kowalevskii]|uniref:Tripartite motif-containing protein 2-like n=1 Tax=Saccoglossus kowalevskii TaxID=10224 RepID=A0ABM0M574_SACKO|nr:PREDICTED: tripartite motif-containing protein 2-like [Saccoglossus kowalevskii]
MACKFADEFLHCTNCSELYTGLHTDILPCLPSDCEQCTNTLVEKTGQTIHCHQCGRTYLIKVPDFTNETAKFDFDESAKYSTCSVCSKDNALHMCMDCDIAMCALCVEVHEKFPAMRYHIIAEVDCQSPKCTQVYSVPYCSQHVDNRLKLYCDQCEIAMCFECKVLDHYDHEHRYIDVAAADYKARLEETIKILNIKEHELSVTKVSVQNVTTSLENRFKTEKTSLLDHIELTVENIVSKIQEQGILLENEMEREYDDKHHKLEIQMNELDMYDSDLQCARKHTQELMHCANPFQLLSAKKDMESKINKITLTATTQSPSEDDYIEFCPSNDYYETRILGEVVNRRPCEQKSVSQIARVGEEVNITMSIPNGWQGSRPSNIDATMMSQAKKKEKVEVLDNKDGTLLVRYRANSIGEHELLIPAYKTPVMCPPIRINVMPKKGLLCKFGGSGSAAGQLGCPLGIALSTSGNILVCEEMNRQIQVFTINGEHVRYIKFDDFAEAFIPLYLVASLDGTIFITDYGNKQVVVCDEFGTLVRCFGRDELKDPRGISISPTNERVYVADWGAHCIRMYRQDGKYIASFGCHGDGDLQFKCLWGLAVDINGNVFSSDRSKQCIQVCDSNGIFLYAFGIESGCESAFWDPVSVAVDKDGYLYITDNNNDRLFKCDSQGNFVSRIDCANARTACPFGICVSDDKPLGHVIVTDETNCVKIFAQ